MIRKTLFFSLYIILAGMHQLNAQVNTPGYTAKDSAIMYVNGEGMYVTLGVKDKVKLNINGTIQAGAYAKSIDVADEITKENRLSMNLVRLGFYGSALHDRLNVGILSDFTGTTGILEGWISIASKNKQIKFTVGEKQTNTNNRLGMADEKFASFLGQTIGGTSVDGSVYGGLMQNFVGATREGGLFLETNFRIGKAKIYPSVSMTTGEGPAFFDPQTNPGFKYGGRIDIMPLGDFIRNNAFIAQDIYFEPKPKLVIGFAGSYNVKASHRTGAGNGEIAGIYDTAGKPAYADYIKIVADFIFKYKGFAFLGEFVNGSVYGKDLFTDALGSIRLTPEVAGTKYSLGNALNLQTSYVSKKGWAFEGRYSNITPEFDTEGSIVQTQSWYSAGFGKYFKNNAVKIGINTTYIDEKGVTASTFTWMHNLAVQISF